MNIEKTSIVAGLIASTLFYIMPKMAIKIFPTFISVHISGGLIVNAICASRHKEAAERNANVIYEMFRGFAKSTATFLLGEIPIPKGIHPEVTHG